MVVAREQGNDRYIYKDSRYTPKNQVGVVVKILGGGAVGVNESNFLLSG